MSEFERVIFSASGSDERILSLARLLGGSWEGRPIRVGDVTVDGKRAELNHGIILVVSDVTPDDDPFDQVVSWLEGNVEAISGLGGCKTLEFETVLPPGYGSKILLVPQEVVDLCCQLGCRIGHQCIRVPSEDELAGRRKNAP